MPETGHSQKEYPELDNLQAGLLLLMDQYAETPCRGVAMAVAKQMERLLRHPLIDLMPELQRQCSRRLAHWHARTHCATPWQTLSSNLTH